MARGHHQRTSTEPHADRPSVSLRLDRSTKDKLDSMAAAAGTSPAEVMERFICDGLSENGEDVKPPNAELRAARAVAVKVKVRVAKALGAIVDSIERELT